MIRSKYKVLYFKRGIDMKIKSEEKYIARQPLRTDDTIKFNSHKFEGSSMWRLAYVHDLARYIVCIQIFDFHSCW